MIIVSQDRTEIVNFNNIKNICIDTNETCKKIIVLEPMMSICLGSYKTEERAKEVLQDIATIQEFKSIGDYMAITSDKIEFGNDFTNVFYMPEE